MVNRLILASGSAIRQELLRNAGVAFEVDVARVDEETIKASLIAEGAPPRDVADALAEFKAQRVANRHSDALVLGCDQVLEFEGGLLSKPESSEVLAEQLRGMRGKRHKLHSAAVIYEKGEPVWRKVAEVTLTMRDVSDGYIENYIARNWDAARHCVGGYQLEGEGARLFAYIQGDYFAVLGIPLLDILGYLTTKGILDG